VACFLHHCPDNEAVCASETSAYFSDTAQCYIPESYNLKHLSSSKTVGEELVFSLHSENLHFCRHLWMSDLENSFPFQKKMKAFESHQLPLK
jgi:hypothetical protein